jgi:hypothetical protein
LEVYTGFDRLTREEECASMTTSKFKILEYRVCDYLVNLGISGVDFKSYIVDRLRGS